MQWNVKKRNKWNSVNFKCINYLLPVTVSYVSWTIISSCEWLWFYVLLISFKGRNKAQKWFFCWYSREFRCFFQRACNTCIVLRRTFYIQYLNLQTACAAFNLKLEFWNECWCEFFFFFIQHLCFPFFFTFSPLP